MRLSIIIPAYNEEKTLPGTLRDIHNYLSRQDYDYEVIVNNDGSKDKTADVVRELQDEIKNLHLIDNKENRGKGAGVKKGMLQAKGEIRLFMDADNSTSISHIEKMWPEFEKGADVVIGTRDSRDNKKAGQAVPQPYWKRLIGDIGNIAIQVLLLPGIWDTQCGFKAFTWKAAEKLFKQSKDFKWAFDVEVLTLARKMDYKTAIIPVHWINNPESTFKLKGYIRFFREFFQIWGNFLTNKYKL